MRVRALIQRIVRQFVRDKRTLALMFIAPMLILWLLSLVFAGDTYEPRVGVITAPEVVVSKLEESGAIIHKYAHFDEADHALVAGELDAYFSVEVNGVVIKLEGSDPAINKSVILLLQKAFQALNPMGQVMELKISYLFGSDDMDTFDNIGPFLIGYFAFFFVFLIAGVSFLRERTGGTLERLLATPLRRWEIVAGYVIGFGIFTMIQATLITWFAIEVLDIFMIGSFWYVLLITLLLTLTALTLGTFLSAYANNEFQIIQFIPLIIVPQAFFSGLFKLETMNVWLQKLSVIMPLTYGSEALRNVMIRGKGWDAIATDVYVLIGFSLFFMIANVLALRKHRKI